jgi:hypothetical protein
MIDWRRKRAPEDVPTPVAVAISDFCRRARSVASPRAVRDALSCLDETRDPELKALAETEPRASPLGPFAVVEVLGGVDQSEAAQHELSGRYVEVRRLLDPWPSAAGREPEDPRLSAAPDQPQTSAAPSPKSRSGRARRTKELAEGKAASLKDRIRPQKRTPSAAPEIRPPAPPQLFGSSFLPRRSLPAPRGRFTRIDPQRSTFESLLRSEARELVESMVSQTPHRFALLLTLDRGFSGPRGLAFSCDDVLAVVERHRLTPALTRKEREAVMGAVVAGRGALGRAARSLRLRSGELRQLITELGLDHEVETLRQRFGREVLDGRNLALRLEFVGQSGYLSDLGVESKFELTLARDLKGLIEAAGASGRLAEVAELLAKRHALPRHLLERALERFGPLELSRSS